MPERPSVLWKQMSSEQRVAAAEAFWREDQADIEVQHAEATVMLARRMKFRVKSVHALPIERRARLLSQLHDLPDGIATRALISYHFTQRRDLMAAFLDALGIAHENGLISDESVPPPPAGKLKEAITTLRSKFPEADVDLYMKTLATLDGDTWAGIDEALG